MSDARAHTLKYRTRNLIGVEIRTDQVRDFELYQIEEDLQKVGWLPEASPDHGKLWHYLVFGLIIGCIVMVMSLVAIVLFEFIRWLLMAAEWAPKWMGDIVIDGKLFARTSLLSFCGGFVVSSTGAYLTTHRHKFLFLRWK